VVGAGERVGSDGGENDGGIEGDAVGKATVAFCDVRNRMDTSSRSTI